MPSSGNDFHDLCTAFGLMTLSWAWAENILASTIGIINRSAGPIKGFPEAPQSLKNKVSCLKIALRPCVAEPRPSRPFYCLEPRPLKATRGVAERSGSSHAYRVG
jgi:hypothetical protein